MKSMKPKKPFTLEDFEKGLMLAGYLMPTSPEEIKETEALESFEKELGGKKRQTYFRRVVLAAEIAAQLHDELTLGRVKFQKMVYLCEYAADMKLADRYQKQTAGPFDNKFMHTITKEFRRNKWFDTREAISNEMKRTIYIPLENLHGYKQYYQRYFGDFDNAIQHVIELFRKKSTSDTELAATVHACILELFAKDQLVTKNRLLQLFYEWSEAKARFTETVVLRSAGWLNENGLIDIEVIG